MKKLFILAVLVGSILAVAGWKPDATYIYSINSKSLSILNEFGTDYRGVIIKGFLKLQAGTAPNVTLNGQLTDLQYADIQNASPNECTWSPEESSVHWKKINLSNTTFGAKVKNGIITEIFLSKNTPLKEANIIRTYLSQLQIDLEGKNKIESKIFSKEYKKNNASTSFSTMEESVTGKCETIYDISPLPENVIRSKPALAPVLSTSKEFLNVLDVVKISNFNNCERHLIYHRGMNGKNNSEAGTSNIADVINRKMEGRVIINGTLEDYTIHSTVIKDKIFVAPSLYKTTKGMTVSCVNLTLVQIEKSTLPLLLNFEIDSTLSYDYEYKSNENIDISSGSFDGKDKDSENKIRSARHINSASDPEIPSLDMNSTTDIPNSTPTDATNLPEENTTISFLSNSTTSPYIENSTNVTPHTENNNVETTSEITETSTVPSSSDINVVTSTMAYNTTLDITDSTLEYDLPVTSESVSTIPPDTLNNINDNDFSNISSVLQFLNVSKGLQNLHLSSFTSVYPSNDKSALPQSDIEQAITTISGNIASNILNFKTIIHENVLSLFCQLTYLLSNVEYEVLHRVSNILYQSQRGSDEKQRLAWVVFRDAAVQSGTGPALILIKEWILFNKLTVNEAEDILGALSRTSEFPNEEYIDGLFGIVQDSRIQKQESVHASAVLAFSNIIHQVHVDRYAQKALYPVHVFDPMIRNTNKLKDVYLKYLHERLENAVKNEDSCKIHIYIRALCNVAHPEILNILKQYLRSDSPLTTFQKAFIVISLEKITELYPEETRNFLYTLYIDDKEHYEVRTAAVFQLMHTKPPASILKKIVELSQFDSSNQVIAAVKSSIQSATQLTNPEDEEFKENAKLVMHLLNSKNLGIQYSFNSFKSQMLEKLGNLGYRQSFSYIGSDNSIVPKGIFISLERFLGGLTAGKENYGILLSDTKKMSLTLANLWDTSNTDSGSNTDLGNKSQQENTQLGKDNQNQKNSSKSFSPAESGNNSNKHINADQDQPESVLFWHLANGEKFITFGKDFSSSLKNWLQQKAKSLKAGYKFNYTKLFQRDVFIYAVPNAAGFITQIFYRVPTIYHLSGKVKINFQKSQQPKDGLKTESQTVALSGRLNLGYALNKHTDIGFVTPFNENRYIVGYKEQLLINIPIIVNTTVSTSEQRMKIRTRVSPITSNTLGFYSQFNSQLYRQHDVLSDIVKKLNTNSLPVQITDSLLQQKIVKRFGGLLLNASLPQTENEPYLEQGNIYTSLFSALSLQRKLKTVHNINVIFSGDFPSDKSSITLQTLYEKVMKENAEADSKLNFSTNKQKSNRNPVKGSNSIVMEWNVLLNEDKTPKLTASLNYTWSEFSNNTKCIFSIYEAAKEKNSRPSPKVTFQFDGTWAKAQLFNLSKAIINNPQSEFKAILLLGSSDKPIAIAECKLQRSAERKNYLLEQPEIKTCQKEMEEGNYILPPCQLASQDMDCFDQHNCSIKIEGFSAINNELMLALNVIHRTHNNFFYYPRRETDLQNQISLLTQFAPNFESANVSVLFPDVGAKFNNVRIPSLLRSIVKIHPTQAAITRTAQSLFRNQYSPTCVLDKTKLNTFDNRTYSVKFGPCWFVLLALSYQNAADTKLSKNNILVLIREVKEGRVMRIMVGDDVVDITTQELNKQNSYKYIYVNDKQYRVPKNEITNIALSSQNNNKKLLTTVVDDIIKLQFTNISLIFDGTRVQLTIGNKYRNQVLGLCGTFTGEEHDDFDLPTDCNIIDSKQFIASYAILNNNTCTEQDLDWAKIAMNKSCSLTGDILIRSEFPKTTSCHNDHNKVSDPRCMSRYNQVLQQDKFTCFSQRSLTKCKPSCYPTKIVKKNVKFHCVETAILSKHFVEVVKSGKVHDFSKKPTTKNITVDIPAGCYKC